MFNMDYIIIQYIIVRKQSQYQTHESRIKIVT